MLTDFQKGGKKGSQTDGTKRLGGGNSKKKNCRKAKRIGVDLIRNREGK